ncbi:hypothetical protein [Oceanithermus sp.]
MKHLTLLLVLLLGFTAAQSQQADKPRGPVTFAELLEEAGMEYEIPAGFEEAPVEYNEVLPYQYRVRSTDGTVEIRYTIFPLDRVEIDYDDPHSSAPEPDHLFTLLFPGILTELSGWGHYKSKDYPPDEALRLFRADWAAVAVMEVIPEYSPDFRQALVVAMHRNGHADAYQIFLGNDLKHLGVVAARVEASLRFKE